jgi:hypothetical protein
MSLNLHLWMPVKHILMRMTLNQNRITTTDVIADFTCLFFIGSACSVITYTNQFLSHDIC